MLMIRLLTENPKQNRKERKHDSISGFFWTGSRCGYSSRIFCTYNKCWNDKQGSRTYELRKQLFERQKAAVEKEMEKMQETLDMLTFKCFYYEQAIKDGNEDGIHSMLPDKLPADIQAAYDNSHK